MSETSPREPAPVRGPIFIVGAMGTGTTLLRLMLDSHEHIAIPHETGFMRIYLAMRCIPFKWSGWHWAERLGFSREERDEEARRYFERMFGRYAEEHGKARWGEKTPQHTWHIESMKRLFPECVFVAMVRHPAASTASNMKRFGHSLDWATFHCNRYHREIARQAAMHPVRMIVLRYEDLVLRSEPVMRELLDWLGEPWSDRTLEHHVIQPNRNYDRIEGGVRAEDPVDPLRVATWTATVPESQQRVMKKRLAGIGEFFGYSMDDPAVLAPLGDGASHLFGGGEVSARIDRFPELDLLTQGPVPLAERPYHIGNVELTRKRYGRHRFQPGRPDAAAPPPPGGLKGLVRKLPAPVRRPVVKGARRVRRRLAAR